MFSLINADYTAAAVLISIGALLGKTSLSQLVIMSTLEVIFQTVNEHIGLNIFKVVYFLIKFDLFIGSYLYIFYFK